MTTTTSENLKTTPMMEQWKSCKKRAKDALLFFRMGDFYEAFHDDAKIIADAIDITLTKRGGTPMCGVPWHAAQNYIDRLVNLGFSVAIAEQMEDPKKTKGLVKRGIVRTITPGTVVNSSLLSEKTNNYISAITRVGAIFGLATLDLTTGEFKVIELEDEKELTNEICRLRPKEFLVSKKFKEKQQLLFKEISFTYKASIAVQEEWFFDHKTAYNFLKEHFQVHHLDGFGLKAMVAAINAAGALLGHIKEELTMPINHVTRIFTYSIEDCLLLDRICQRNLELTESLQDGSESRTLLNIIDHTNTAMGGREIRKWLKNPLVSVDMINNRGDAVEALYFAREVSSLLCNELKGVRDLERLCMKILTAYSSARDFVSLRFSLEKIDPIKNILKKVRSELIFEKANKLCDFTYEIELLTNALVDEPPLRLLDGKTFKEGYDEELDELRKITRGGKQWLANYQNKLKSETGVKNLRVNFNKIFGYYIEVSKGQANLMPETFQRRQTLVNSERFISKALKEYESRILISEEKIEAREQFLFQELREKIAKAKDKIFNTARSIACIDSLLSLAKTARQNNYCRPTIDNSNKLEIIDGRHPIVEASIGKELFIPNDTNLNDTDNRLMLITGPNMAGKSTYIRQVALIVILAQIGSFIPAHKAHIGIVDKIFTRIGASDDLSRGQSTFMVEMSETANILNNVTSRSLVILDEIGRGTSTYDGLSIAWSVAEYLLITKNKLAKTLFATHYGELTHLEKTFTSANNYHASVQEFNESIIFLHKIIKGAADRSYGIHVAKLAGIPIPVISRAKTILAKLEAKKNKSIKNVEENNKGQRQLSLF